MRPTNKNWNPSYDAHERPAELWKELMREDTPKLPLPQRSRVPKEDVPDWASIYLGASWITWL